MPKYKCLECGWVGTEDDMESDYYYIEDVDGTIEEEVWSNWICPECDIWYFDIDEYQEVEDDKASD